MVQSLAPLVRSGIFYFRSGARVLIAASAIVLVTGATSAQPTRSAPASPVTVSAVQRWNIGLIAKLLSSCFAVPGTVRGTVAVAWDKADYYYDDDDLSSADRLNGVTQRGIVTFEVPTKLVSGSSDWALTRQCFHFQRANGISTLMPQWSMYACQKSGSSSQAGGPPFLEDIVVKNWPCHSKG